jgi:hypothetical protein
VPIPEAQRNFLDGRPQKWDLLAVTSADTTNGGKAAPARKRRDDALQDRPGEATTRNRGLGTV